MQGSAGKEWSGEGLDLPDEEERGRENEKEKPGLLFRKA